MNYDVEFRLNSELYIKTYVRDYIEIKNKIAHVKLPDPKDVKPIMTGESTLRLLYAEFNPKLIYRGDVHGTIDGWKYLEEKGIPLGEVTITLAQEEILFLLPKILPAIPRIVSVAEIAYLVYFLKQRNIKNLDREISRIRRKVKGSMKSTEKCLGRGETPKSDYLSTDITSFVSELKVCRELIEAGFNVEFNSQEKGPDIFIEGQSAKIEISRRSEVLNLEEWKEWMKIAQEDPNKATIRLRPDVLLFSTFLNLIDKLKEELNQGDIIIVDVTSTLEGYSLFAMKAFSTEPSRLDLQTAINTALEHAKKGGKSLILYSDLTDTPAAVWYDAQVLLNIEQELINRMGKKKLKELISIRRKYPYTTLKMISDAFELLDKLGC